MKIPYDAKTQRDMVEDSETGLSKFCTFLSMYMTERLAKTVSNLSISCLTVCFPELSVLHFKGNSRILQLFQ